MLYYKAVTLLTSASLIAGSIIIPASLDKRKSACIALGTCPGEQKTNSPAPSSTTPTITPQPAEPTATFGCYHGADPDGAQGFCPAVAATGWCVCSDSSTYAVMTGNGAPCGYTIPPAAGPTTIPTANCDSSPSATAASATAISTATRNLCSYKECPKFCDRGSNTDDVKRSIAPLDKRFFEDPNPDTFPYNLLDQSYTRNICPTTPLNTFIWKPFTNRQSAGALQGLSGCTTIFILSSNGAFSSHLWEQDEVNDPPRDLQLANYQSTMRDLGSALTGGAVPEGQLEGGEAFIILPNDPDNPGQLLYPQAVVDALKDTVESSAGVTATLVQYIPLDFETSEELGTNRRGTAAYQFDPKYTDSKGQTSRAYRVYSESRLLSEKADLPDVSSS